MERTLQSSSRSVHLPALLARHWPLLLILAAGLVLRLALWGQLPRTGLISDEAEYLAAADWLARGRGFTWHQEWLWTRAPLYPLFLAAHVRLFGLHTAPISLSQIGLSLINIGLVYVLALQLTGARRPAVVAGLLTALYLPFATYTQIVLSETLYLTLLLAAWVCLGVWVADVRRDTGAVWRPRLALVMAGLLLGLASLTRGLTLGFLPLVAFWIWHTRRRVRRTASARARWAPVGAALVFGVCAVLMILPWSLYASRLYGGTIIVDTTGAYNLLLGARTAYDGERRDAPARNFVLALLDRQYTPEERRALLGDACLYRQGDARLLAALDQPVTTITQGDRQRLMTAEGLCLLRAAPGAFVRKSLVELVDLFQINYTGAERLTDGFALGRLARWYSMLLFWLDDTLYVLLLPLAVLGWAQLWRRTDEEQRPIAVTGALITLIGLWWLYNLLTAPLLFAINRFRLPLLPFAFICAAYLLFRQRGTGPPFALRRDAVGSMRRPWLWLALVLFLIASTPYAYLQAPPSSWASYLGPYPSSIAATARAWQTRPAYLSTQQVQAALGRGDAAQARAVLATEAVPGYTRAVAGPLLAALEGAPAAGLALLEQQPYRPLAAWQTSVVRGDLLRHLGDWDAAQVVLSPTQIDDQNPVEWAWQWLYPAALPGNRLDLGGDLDLGYIQGFYLGEGDPQAGGTFRWSGPQARLRFPQAGSGAPQQLCLRSDGRGWYADLPMPRVQFVSGGQTFAHMELERAIRETCVPLPVTPPGADIVVTLRTETFVPDAADLLARQGPQVGQLRRLGVRLDWAEVRGLSDDTSDE